MLYWIGGLGKKGKDWSNYVECVLELTYHHTSLWLRIRNMQDFSQLARLFFSLHHFLDVSAAFSEL